MVRIGGGRERRKKEQEKGGERERGREGELGDNRRYLSRIMVASSNPNCLTAVNIQLCL